MTRLGLAFAKGDKSNPIRWILQIFSIIGHDYLTFLSKEFEFSKSLCLNTSH